MRLRHVLIGFFAAVSVMGLGACQSEEPIERTDESAVSIQRGTTEQFCEGYKANESFQPGGSVNSETFTELADRLENIPYPEELVADAEQLVLTTRDIAANFERVAASGDSDEVLNLDEAEAASNRISSYASENCEGAA